MEPWQRRRRQESECPSADYGERNPERPSGETQRQRFHQQLAENANTGRTERSADCDLSLAGEIPNEE